MTAANPTINAHDRAPIELPHRTRMEILVAVLLGIFLSALDQTIVGTALPRIVTDLQGNRIGFLRALVRNIAKIVSAIILYIGFIMAGFTARKQALHDMIAGCLVVAKSA